MAKQKFRPTRRSVFSRVKTYTLYVEILKERYNTVGRNFRDAIKLSSYLHPEPIHENRSLHSLLLANDHFRVYFAERDNLS